MAERDTRIRNGQLQRDAPEQIEKAEHLDQHPNDRPLEEDEEYAAEEAGGPAQLVPSREKGERLLWADDEEESTEEEDLHACVTPSARRGHEYGPREK